MKSLILKIRGSLVNAGVSKIAGLIFLATLSFGCFADGVNAGQLDIVKAKLDEKFSKVIDKGNVCKWGGSYHHHAITDIKKDNNELVVEGEVKFTCSAVDGLDGHYTWAFRAKLKQLLDDYELTLRS